MKDCINKIININLILILFFLLINLVPVGLKMTGVITIPLKDFFMFSAWILLLHIGITINYLKVIKKIKVVPDEGINIKQLIPNPFTVFKFNI